MHKLRNYLLVALAVAAMAITLAVTGLGPKVAQAAPPEKTAVFQEQFECLVTTSSRSCTTPAYVVPSGKRLVVEYASGVGCLTGNPPMVASLGLGADSHRLALGDGRPWIQWTCRELSQQILAFAEQGESVSLWFGTDPAGPTGNVSVTVGGYLVPAS